MSMRGERLMPRRPVYALGLLFRMLRARTLASPMCILPHLRASIPFLLPSLRLHRTPHVEKKREMKSRGMESKRTHLPTPRPPILSLPPPSSIQIEECAWRMRGGRVSASGAHKVDHHQKRKISLIAGDDCNQITRRWRSSCERRFCKSSPSLWRCPSSSCPPQARGRSASTIQLECITPRQEKLVQVEYRVLWPLTATRARPARADLSRGVERHAVPPVERHRDAGRAATREGAGAG
jgi:hypothetical protein